MAAVRSAWGSCPTAMYTSTAPPASRCIPSIRWLRLATVPPCSAVQASGAPVMSLEVPHAGHFGGNPGDEACGCHHRLHSDGLPGQCDRQRRQCQPGVLISPRYTGKSASWLGCVIKRRRPVCPMLLACGSVECKRRPGAGAGEGVRHGAAPRCQAGEDSHFPDWARHEGKLHLLVKAACF